MTPKTTIAAALRKSHPVTIKFIEEKSRKDGYKAGAKETKERALLAIKMAGGMAEMIGSNPIISETIARIYVLVEALPVEIVEE